MRRRIEIVAFERTRVVRQAEMGKCPVCLSSDGLLTSAQVAALFQVCDSSIRRWLEQGKVHGFMTADGQYRICWRSLFPSDWNE
jgi:hypothetical protein